MQRGDRSRVKCIGVIDCLVWGGKLGGRVCRVLEWGLEGKGRETGGKSMVTAQLGRLRYLVVQFREHIWGYG